MTEFTLPDMVRRIFEAEAIPADAKEMLSGPQRGLGAICRQTLLPDALVPVIRAAAPDLFSS